eukprot:UN11142
MTRKQNSMILYKIVVNQPKQETNNYKTKPKSTNGTETGETKDETYPKKKKKSKWSSGQQINDR